ncbi:ABC transporter ATP-binding protein [Acidovorax sp.]|uniref:ABC transporter ATP-binding protein n=1 Tax=Acidovorax sp. TaxID=1872122 RepID=UPI004037B372
MLELKNISAGYGRTEVLHDVSLKVPQGKLVALIGSNGAGKTTTMRVASGMLSPNAGSLLLDYVPYEGEDSHQVSRRGVAHVPEGRKVFPTLSVKDNLEVGAFRNAKFGRLSGEARHDLEMVFERFPRLKERRDQLAGTLSGGEQQMLAIGRGLMARPAVLLLDEPSMGLAPKIVEEVFETVLELKRAGMTMLLVEQFADAALRIADYAYVLESGHIALHGAAESLRSDPAVREAYLGKVH